MEVEILSILGDGGDGNSVDVVGGVCGCLSLGSEKRTGNCIGIVTDSLQYL